MLEASEKVINPLIDPDSVRDTAENIAAVVSYLQCAEVALESGDIFSGAIAGRNLVFQCIHQAAEFIANK